jgi:hypothetical protein
VPDRELGVDIELEPSVGADSRAGVEHRSAVVVKPLALWMLVPADATTREARNQWTMRVANEPDRDPLLGQVRASVRLILDPRGKRILGARVPQLDPGPLRVG